MTPFYRNTLIITIIVLIGLSIAGYFIIRKRYSSDTNTPPTNNQETPATEQSTSLSQTTETPSTSNTLSNDTVMLDPQILQPPEDNNQSSSSSNTPENPIVQTLPSKNTDSYLPISKVDCQNNCKQFSGDDKLRYCQEYCGLASSDQKDNCEELKDLEQDYCFKAQAIEKTDPSVCKKIRDKNILTACQNRILEDIVDKQQSED